jgi:hypothetical protein
VAFSAFIPEGDYMMHEWNHVLPFTSVITNVGNAYDSTTGIFTCPFDGDYFISVVANVIGFGEFDWLIIMKNDAELARADRDDTVDTVVRPVILPNLKKKITA